MKSESATSRTSSAPGAKRALPEFEDFVLKRDYTGARTLLEVRQWIWQTRSLSNPNIFIFLFALQFSVSKTQETLSKEWTAFCDFHLGNYRKSLDEYESLKGVDRIDDEANRLNIAVCMFYLGMNEWPDQNPFIYNSIHVIAISTGMYAEAQAIIESLPNSPLKVRLLFHLSHKLNDEDRLLELHGSLRDVTEDQLSLASMHYLRGHYQDAIDIYKRVLLDKK